MAEEVIIARETPQLTGTVRVSGAKNSALKLIAASILGQGASTLTNIPIISDIDIMCEVLERLGARVERNAPRPPSGGLPPRDGRRRLQDARLRRRKMARGGGRLRVALDKFPVHRNGVRPGGADRTELTK